MSRVRRLVSWRAAKHTVSLVFGGGFLQKLCLLRCIGLDRGH